MSQASYLVEYLVEGARLGNDAKAYVARKITGRDGSYLLTPLFEFLSKELVQPADLVAEGAVAFLRLSEVSERLFTDDEKRFIQRSNAVAG